MDYNHITGFLDKFKKILFQGQRDHKIIVDIITKHISFPIKEDMLKIKGSVVFIQGSPTLKNEIMIHKSGILSDIQSMVTNRRITDIK